MEGRYVMVLGAGASLAAPSLRPLFAWLREALVAPLELDIEDRAWDQMAPEALISRLAAAGINIDAELRRMLAGGSPNAVHAMAAELLRRRGAVWTTNFDELVENAAATAGIELHRILPGEEPQCTCNRGHLLKVHGTLSGEHVVARSEEVLLPLERPWLARLAADFAAATVAVVGYAGADVDLRTGLRDALGGCAQAVWFGTARDADPLRRRFAEPLASGKLELRMSSRPDLAALDWGCTHGLAAGVPAGLKDAAKQPTARVPVPRASYSADALLRARLADDFGRVSEARRLYRTAAVRGPRRRRAARAVYSSGLIHGAPWRPLAIALLNAACTLPLSWRWPHRQRLPYLTWNVPADRRLELLERSLAVAPDDPVVVLSAANAAKEVDPARAIELARDARASAVANRDPPDAAWATFTLSLALRWLGDIDAAGDEASRLADGYDALAGPVWVAWGHFEQGAVAALQGRVTAAQEQMQLAVEVFTAAGSMFAFDAWCGAIAVHRAAGDLEGQRAAYREARRLVESGSHRHRFKREVLLVEEGEFARQEGRLGDAEKSYRALADSPTLAQQLLGLLGLGEVERARDLEPAAAREALRRSRDLGFGYGRVHAAVTLGLAGAIDVNAAEREIAASPYDPPVRPGQKGLLRFSQGAAAEDHILCFP